MKMQCIYYRVSYYKEWASIYGRFFLLLLSFILSCQCFSGKGVEYLLLPFLFTCQRLQMTWTPEKSMRYLYFNYLDFNIFQSWRKIASAQGINTPNPICGWQKTESFVYFFVTTYLWERVVQIEEPRELPSNFHNLYCFQKIVAAQLSCRTPLDQSKRPTM